MANRSFAPNARAAYARGASMRRERPQAEPAPALTRNVLIPLSITTCFVLVYVIEAPPFWVLPIGGAVMALYLAAPVLGKRSLSRFDRDLVQLLATGRRGALPARYRRALGMRFFAAPALAAERRGLIAAESGHPQRALEAYRAAVEGYGDGEAPLSVRLGLAHASYAVGEDDEAIRSYRAVLRDNPGLPKVKTNLVHALARSGRDLAEAERLSEELLREAGDPPSTELRMLRALVHARRGQRGPAKKLLRAAADDGGSEHVETLRDELREALEGRR